MMWSVIVPVSIPGIVDWSAWWIYFVGPLAGMLIGLSIHEFTWLKRLRIEVAKIYHFEHDRYGFFKRQQS